MVEHFADCKMFRHALGDAERHLYCKDASRRVGEGRETQSGTK